jgi:hypothetical protein
MAASSWPNRCTTFFTHASTSASFVASATMLRSRDSGGAPVGIAAFRTGIAASRASWSMSMRATLQPSMSSRPADSTPTFPPPPVMRTTLPSRRWIGSGLARFVDVGARSMPGRGALFRLSVEMLLNCDRRLSVVFARCILYRGYRSVWRPAVSCLKVYYPKRGDKAILVISTPITGPFFYSPPTYRRP